MGQPDIVRNERRIDLFAQRIDGCPLFLRIRLGDARILMYPRHAHEDTEFGFAHIGIADHRGGVARVRGAREGNVAFAGEQSGRGIEPDPACARQIRLGPCVQVGEIPGRPWRSVQRLDVGHQLNQVTGDETRGEPQAAQDLNEQPAAVAT